MSTSGIIIGFGNQKGGVGKSSVACQLAGGFAVRFPHMKVMLVNADKNTSATRWINFRDELNEELSRQGKPTLPHIDTTKVERDANISRQLKSLREKYDVVIVDTGGHDNMAFKSMLLTADIIYAPFQPSQFDLDELIPTLQKVAEYEEQCRSTFDLDDFTIDIRLLLAKVEHTSDDLKQQAKEFCKELTSVASLSSVAIPRAKVFVQTASTGESLHDIKNKHRAHIDFLIDEILGNRELSYKRES